MAMIDYTVRRNVPALDDNDREMQIALIFIRHENGMIQRLAIEEEKIKFCGEGIIDLEVKEAALKEGTYLKEAKT